MEEWDYQLLARRSRLTAVMVAAVSVVLAVAVLSWRGRPPASAARDAMAPAAAIPAGSVAGCTRSDLSAPQVRDMPLPEVVTATLVIHPDPDLERLSPPDSLPRISAAAAWTTMARHGWPVPTTAGSAQIILGELFATTPALVGPGNTALPIYSHTLVWAIYGVHQPEASASRSGAADPPCYFESTVFYVDAQSGRPLEGEVFTPPGAVSPAV